ncbi:AGBL5 [Lepeophtheirus salmonis]|uniref:AGBL5 n=1 Tax=Lepeophtheirus salmonis TaxID=72036 RepID=A0A7R8D7G9_LEPSM|nr:AGBL5 [Lepeophtheirus salmonis]CAF3025727.1 AGBL5 [Lepeophtheirus salmonis]
MTRTIIHPPNIHEEASFYPDLKSQNNVYLFIKVLAYNNNDVILSDVDGRRKKLRSRRRNKVTAQLNSGRDVQHLQGQGRESEFPAGKIPFSSPTLIPSLKNVFRKMRMFPVAPPCPKTRRRKTEEECRGPNLKGNFKCWTRPDCAGTRFENGNRTWFNFGMKQAKLFSQGFSPVVCIDKEENDETTQWKRLSNIYYKTIDNQFYMSFVFNLSRENRYKTHYFAFTYPYSFLELEKTLNRFALQYENSPNIYFHKAIGTYSYENRPIYVLTISGMNGLTDKEESIPLSSGSSPKMFRSKKKISDGDSKTQVIEPLKSEVFPSTYMPSKLDISWYEMTETSRCSEGDESIADFSFNNFGGGANMSSTTGGKILDVEEEETSFFLSPTTSASSSNVRSTTTFSEAFKKNMDEDFNRKLECTLDGPEQNLFLYLDIHGHASKRGIFILP